MARLKPGLSDAPTISTPALVTGAGMILGTAAYMAPEQARGKTVDKRADIWAFGAVLFEMLTGRRAFEGEDIADTLGNVMKLEPNWRSVPASTPPRVAQVMRACLQKNPKQRIDSAQDVRLALEGAFETMTPPAAQSTASAHWGWRRALPYAVGAVVASLAIGIAGVGLWPSAAPEPVVAFDHTPPDGQALVLSNRPAIAISPDGRSLLYQTTEGLYIRALGELQARRIPGTDGLVTGPFFSPDGQWVGFFSGLPSSVVSGTGDVKKVSVTGGMPVTLCQADFLSGASWSQDNTILFGQPAGIMRVSANGGTPELIVPARDGEQIYGPQRLPGGDSVLFSVTEGTESGITRWERGQVVVQQLSSGVRTVVVEGGSDGHYLASGHLVYASRNGLFGVAFDPARPRVATGAVPLVQDIQYPVSVIAAGMNYAVSDQGTLAYVPAFEASRSLVWMNRDGTPAGRVGSIPDGPYESPRLSPDGHRVLLTRDGDIWIYDIDSGRGTRLTRDGSSQYGVSDQTGARVAYSSRTESGGMEAWLRPSDGGGEPRQLTRLGGQVHVDAWSPDGRLLTIHQHPLERPTQMFALPMDQADPSPQPLFHDGGPFSEGAHLSRDGRYVAYVSIEGQTREVQLRPYPGPGGRQTVSTAGGTEPVWAGNGDLFYRSPTDGRMFRVSIATAPTLRIGAPVEVSQRSDYTSPTGSPRAEYDVTPDGQRLLMLAPSEGSNGSAARPRVVVVLNWSEELKRLVPAQ